MLPAVHTPAPETVWAEVPLNTKAVVAPNKEEALMVAELVRFPFTVITKFPKLREPRVTERLPAMVIVAPNAPTVPVLLQVKLPNVVAATRPLGLVALTPEILQ